MDRFSSYNDNTVFFFNLIGGKSNQQVSSTYVDDVAQSVAQRIRRIERSIPPTVSSLDSLESIMTVSREFLKEKSVFEL